MEALEEKMAEWADRVHGDVLCLFDVDGTLTPARRVREREREREREGLDKAWREGQGLERGEKGKEDEVLAMTMDDDTNGWDDQHVLERDGERDGGGRGRGLYRGEGV